MRGARALPARRSHRRLHFREPGCLRPPGSRIAWGTCQTPSGSIGMQFAFWKIQGNWSNAAYNSGLGLRTATARRAAWTARTTRQSRRKRRAFAEPGTFERGQAHAGPYPEVQFTAGLDVPQGRSLRARQALQVGGGGDVPKQAAAGRSGLHWQDHPCQFQQQAEADGGPPGRAGEVGSGSPLILVQDADLRLLVVCGRPEFHDQGRDDSRTAKHHYQEVGQRCLHGDTQPGLLDQPQDHLPGGWCDHQEKRQEDQCAPHNSSEDIPGPKAELDIPWYQPKHQPWSNGDITGSCEGLRKTIGSKAKGDYHDIGG